MLHDPDDIELFPRLSAEAVQHLSQHGVEIPLEAGDSLFKEGDDSCHFYVILEGEIKITKTIDGQEQVLATHHHGEFTGELSLLTGQPAMASGHAVNASRVLRIDAADFKQALAHYAPLADIVFPAMAGRSQEVESHTRQQGKLAALGKLSAGLAHELNNPAAAAHRAAKQLLDINQSAQRRILAQDQRFTDAQREVLTQLLNDAANSAQQAPLDPLTQSDREEQLMQWLEQHGVAEPWRLTSSLVSAGLDEQRLAPLGSTADAHILTASIEWLETALAVTGLIAEIEQSTKRISELVGAMKQYSYMDTATRQEVDIHDGLESTLTILGHKLKQGITVIRDYDRNLPRICVYGSELNQVWTNIIDNAIDAMQGSGKLTLRTARDDGHILVEIADDGPGIPEKILERIWEPFFTTKGVGEGSGLGLDITRRIVTRRHDGEISVDSQPGETCFQVRLPVELVPSEPNES